MIWLCCDCLQHQLWMKCVLAEVVVACTLVDIGSRREGETWRNFVIVTNPLFVLEFWCRQLRIDNFGALVHTALRYWQACAIWIYYYYWNKWLWAMLTSSFDYFCVMLPVWKICELTALFIGEIGNILTLFDSCNPIRTCQYGTKMTCIPHRCTVPCVLISPSGSRESVNGSGDVSTQTLYIYVTKRLGDWLLAKIYSQKSCNFFCDCFWILERQRYSF